MAISAVQTWVLTALALQLLECLKKQLDLPPFLVDRGQCGGTELKMIAQEHQSELARQD